MGCSESKASSPRETNQTIEKSPKPLQQSDNSKKTQISSTEEIIVHENGAKAPAAALESKEETTTAIPSSSPSFLKEIVLDINADAAPTSALNAPTIAANMQQATKNIETCEQGTQTSSELTLAESMAIPFPLIHQSSVNSVSSETTKSALRAGKSNLDLSPKKSLRFNFDIPEADENEENKNANSAAADGNVSDSNILSDSYQEVSGEFGGYEYPFFGGEDLYRIEKTEAALKITPKFSVLTHLSYEKPSTADIILDNAPAEKVHKEMARQSSFRRMKSMRFETQESSSPVISSPLISPSNRSAVSVLTPSKASAPTPTKTNTLTPSKVLLMSKGRSERIASTRQELVRLESGYNFESCAVCDTPQNKGVYCMDDMHFICTDCFSPHVQNLCQDMRQLKGQFAVYCPVPHCLALPWNSYHVSKCLTGRVLELCIDTLVNVCKEVTTMSNPLVAPDSSHLSQVEFSQLRESVSMLKSQLLHAGLRPIEYIPLGQLNAELADIFALANDGLAFDEDRLDYLLLCMDNNPEYIAQQEEKNKAWRAEIMSFANNCLKVMRGYVPPHIFSANNESLTQVDMLHADLAKRFLTKKCLWLVRLHPNSIDKIHEVELMGRFNFEAQRLDVVELAALYAALPEKFTCDPSGKKTQWKSILEQSLKKVDTDERARAMALTKKRLGAYSKQQPLFTENEELFEFSHN